MKHAIWIFFLFIGQSIAIAQKASVSSNLINENFQNVELKQVLSLLKNKYGIKTAYGEKIVKNKKISAVLINNPADEGFSIILSGTGLDFEMVEPDVVIIKKQKQFYDGNQEPFFDLIGSVKDAFSGESLPYAYIWIDQTKKSLAANVEGYFSLIGTKLPATLKVSYLGYKDTTVLISNQASKKRINVRLIPHPQNLKEVVVTDQITNAFQLNETAGKVTINPVLASSIPATGEQDIFRSLQLLPGINATNEISSGLNVRGGTTNQNLVLFDGFTVYHVDHFFGYFSAFNPHAIKSVRLFKGGYGAEYGGRVSSIIDISGKDGNKYKTAGTLGLNLLSINTTLEVPLSNKNTTLFLSGRRSYTDIITTPLFENIFSNFSSGLTKNPDNIIANNPGNSGHHMGNGGNNNNNQQGVVTENSTLNPEFFYSDFNIKISSNISAKNRLSLSVYNSKDILNFTENVTSDINDTLNVQSNTIGFINWGNTGLSLKFSRLWSNEHYSNFLISYSKYNSTFNDISNSTSQGQNGTTNSSSNSNQDNGMKDVSFKMDHEWKPNTSNLLKFGLSSSLYTTEFISIADNETIVNEKQNNRTLTNVYLEARFNPLHNLELTVGVRSSYFSPTSRFYFVPRLSANFDLSKKVKIKAAYGHYNQFLNQTNTKNVLQGSRDFWLLADDLKVPVQHATNYLSGLEYIIHDNLIFSIDYYYKKFDGLLEYAFSSGGLVTEFQDFQKLFFEGSGKASGMELLLKSNSKKHQAWIGYTNSRVRYTFNDINDGNSYYADHDRRNEINAYGSLKINDFEIFATWLYASGSPYSLTSSASFGSQDHTNFESHVSVITVDKKNALRLPPYHRLDIGGTYFFSLNHLKAQATLSIFNVYNRRNVQDKKINQIVRGFQTGMRMQNPILQVTDVTLLGIAPNLSVRITF